MGSHPIFKTIDEYTQQQFKAYKTWTLTESTIGQYNSSTNEAIYVSASLLTNDTGHNASGLSKRSLFDSIYRLYYMFPDLPYDALGGNAQFQQRDISDRAIVVSISNHYIGERIKPGSITITDNSTGSILITDDGFGNLINGSDTTAYPASQSLVGYWSFNEGFINATNQVGEFQNKNRAFGFPAATMHNVTYGDGIFGSKVTFDGTSGSFGVVENYRDINFRSNEDFAVSLWVWIPPSQSMKPVGDNSILEKWDNEGGYPFVIRVLNDKETNPALWGKVYCSTWDTINGSGVISNSTLNDNTPHHIVYQKSGSSYTMWVDGTQQGAASVISLNQIHNNSSLFIGARGYKWASSGAIYNFNGSIDELRIYNKSLTAAEIQSLYANPAGTNIIGNAFYSHGILTFTNTSGSYNALMLSGSEFVMNFKSTVTITENTILTTVLPSEFNMTFNPSIGIVYDAGDISYRSIVTGSTWSPYFTTMGLYDDQLNLLAVAKFAQPIKKPIDMPLTIAVRWDS